MIGGWTFGSLRSTGEMSEGDFVGLVGTVFLVIGVVLCIISFLLGFQQIHYSLSAIQVNAEIKVRTVRDSFDFEATKTLPYKIVHLSYHDESGKRHRTKYYMEIEWQEPTDMKIPIEYLPGNPESMRFVGETTAGWLYTLCFGVAFLGMGVCVFFFKKY